MNLKSTVLALLASTAGLCASAAPAATSTVQLLPNADAPVIKKEIYGQFAEHLGRCIYGGIWVGEESGIPNTQGYRTDVLNALRELHVPVLRWPGGCFADEYHWMDGIGPHDKRPVMVNTNWGGTVEDNSFGTNEFFNFCELLGCEPYLSGNVGSGTVEELAKWVEYITAADGPMAELRKANGREKPWRLKYLGVGNESWGCGGNFTADFYANVYRRYQTYCRDFSGNRLYKIASGANAGDYNWTEVLMRDAMHQFNGVSMHYYSVGDWNSKGSATVFDASDYYRTLAICLDMKTLVERHSEIMDRFDPEKRKGLMVDEWGTWWEVEPGTNPGHLYQQNTMRDAIVAALTLNIFHDNAARVHMANIAQLANVLQAMVLTQDAEMVLTPTYYVFKMYVPHQDARLVPLAVTTATRSIEGRNDVPEVSATCSEKDGVYTISLTNTSLEKGNDVAVDLAALKLKVQGAEILTAASVNDYNDFGKPEAVTLKSFKDAKIKDGKLNVSMPPMSIVTISLK
ncbi:MAG: alpha-N-arabinofuranosidase [Muribaculaceae bacterium]|nr:alpha-N-arabinofuranosidase [Muribaculaceae bacterium]